MGKLEEVHLVRYPPFEAHRWIPSKLPLTTQTRTVDVFENRDEAIAALQHLSPPFQLGTRDSWYVERCYQFDGDNIQSNTPQLFLEQDDFVDLIYRQRRGWYLIPNPIHTVLRRFINGVVLVLLLSLFYLFISPVFVLLGIPVYGFETVRWGLLDYPALAIFVVPLIFAPLLLRIIANFVELRRQNKFLAKRPSRPKLEFLSNPVANQPLHLSLSFPTREETWNHIDVFWRVGILPPARETLLRELGRDPARQPPPGLTTELPHHWVVGLDDGTAGGEDAPMERQEVPGGLYLRPMRIMSMGGQQRWLENVDLKLAAPEGNWPGSVNSDLLRVHWECIVRIDRTKGGALLWVEPLHVSHFEGDANVENLPLHDGRSELDIS